MLTDRYESINKRTFRQAIVHLLEREYMIKIVDGPNATKEKELLKILSKNPAFIVFKQASWPEQLYKFEEILDTEIEKNYEMVQTIDTSYNVYKRKNQK